MTSTAIWPRAGELIQDWFAVDEPAPGIFRIQEPLHDENVKSFLVCGTDRAALIDTGMGVGDIAAVVRSLTDLPVTVINSHAHWDHIGGNAAFDDIWIHAAEADGLLKGIPNTTLRPWFQPDRLRGDLPVGVTPESISYPPTPPTRKLAGGERIDLGGRDLEVIHCPGHSPGGIALWDRHHRTLFTTDVAYPCTLYVYGRNDLATYLRTFERLVALSPEPVAVFGSHCDREMPAAMLAAQRDAIAAVIGGLAADAQRDDGVLRWEFDGFALQVG